MQLQYILILGRDWKKNMSDSIESLKAALDASEKAVCDRDRQIAELNKMIETISKIAANFEELLAKSDRKIEILEGNPDRARSEHLYSVRVLY